MAKKLGRKPDYKFKAMNKETDEKGDLGAAWKNEDGSISVVLNPFVSVPKGPDWILMLFPSDDKFSRREEVTE